jgi:hypothetical protein
VSYWQKAIFNNMNTSYSNTFDSSIQGDERAQVSESEYDEVMHMLADERDAGEGYALWSAEVEKKDDLGSELCTTTFQSIG